MKKTWQNVQVVLGFAESFSAPEAVWSLVGCGFPVLAFARRGSRAALRASRFTKVFDVTAPELAVAATVEDVNTQLTRLLETSILPLVLLALDDAAVWVYGQIPANDRLVVVGGGKLHLAFALEKERQLVAAREAGFRVPETLTVREPGDLDGSRLGFPMFLKPARAVSLRGGRLVKPRFHTCRSEVDLRLAIPCCLPGEPMLAQQHVAGVGEGLFGLATRRGVLAWSAHRRIRMMNPLGSGASACRSISPSTEDVAAGTKLIERVGWRGPFMIELMRDAGGRSWFMEFNGRIWGSTALARRCGLEYPAWAVLEAIGQEAAVPAEARSAAGVVCRHAGRETMHALFVMRGSRGRALVKWPSRWHTLRQLLSFRKADYWYNWRRDDWRVFVKDFAATIRENV